MKRRRMSLRRPLKEIGVLAAAMAMLALAAAWGLGQMPSAKLGRVFALWLLAAFGAAVLVTELLRSAADRGGDGPSAPQREERAVKETLGALSHDLRTPVSSVIGMTELALDAAERGESTQEHLHQILVAAQSMKLMMDDLLDAPDCPEHMVFGVDMLRQELSVLVGPRARDKGQRLTIDLGALEGRQFDADYAGLSRILLNLLVNATKYTQEKGEISLAAHIEYQQGDSMRVAFCVKDNGMGMRPEFMQRMYAPYTRARETAQIPGTGLGLSIVKQLVERMKGTVEAQSEWQHGTAFTVSVPLKMAAQAEPKPPAEFSYAGRSFLLAEDNPLSAQIVIRLLAGANAEVKWARDGEEAARLFAQSAEGAFDAVLMDMRMPGMNGCEAAGVIRDMERGDAAQVPILAMTASIDEQDVRRALDAGMDAYVTKPVEMARLGEVLARHLGSGQKG